MEEYIPKIREKGKYVEMLVESKKCKVCGKVMVRKANGGLFPMYFKLNQEAQMKAAGLVYATSTLVDDEPICEECLSNDKADFLCALCRERKPSSKLYQSFGEPAEFLCKDCYSTKPAKLWDEAIEGLYERHRYDYE